MVEVVAAGDELRQAFLTPSRRAAFNRRDTWVQGSDKLRGRIAAANELAPQQLDDEQIADLVAFLESLTDPRSRDLSNLVPTRVPSGLPVED